MVVVENHFEEIVLGNAAAMSGCDASVVVVANILVAEKKWGRLLVSLFLAQKDQFGVHVLNWDDAAYEVHHPLAPLRSMLPWVRRNEAAAAAIVVDVLEVEGHPEPYGYHCIQKTTYSP